MPRKSDTSPIIKPFTIGVFVIMIVSAAVLYALQHTQNGLRMFQRQQQMPNLNELLDQVTPTDEQIAQAFQARLDTGELASKDMGVVTKDGQLLRTRVSKPEGSGPFPIIVILHGGLSSTRETDQTGVLWGEALSKAHNALTIVPDWRDGRMGEEEVTDVISLLAWVRKLREANDQPVFVFGMDHGVYMALATIAAEPDSIDGLIAAYGYSDIAAEYAFLTEHDPLGAQNFFDRTGCADQTAVQLCLQGLSLTALPLTMPTLVVHSAGNSVVPLAQANQLASQVADASRVTTHVVADTAVDHLFLGREDHAGFAEGQQAINDWLAQHL